MAQVQDGRVAGTRTWLWVVCTLVLALVCGPGRPAWSSPAGSTVHLQASPIAATRTVPFSIVTVRVGGSPQAVTVDERTQRVFVIGQGLPRGYAPVGFATGNVTMLDALTGAILQVTPLPGQPYDVALDQRLGRLYVTEAVTNTVAILSATTGALLRSVRVNPGATRLAVDERTQRLFVLTAETLDVLDARTGRRLRMIPGFTEGGIVYQPFALDPPRHRLYSANIALGSHGCTNANVGCVGVIDTTTGTSLPSLLAAQPADGLATDARAGRLLSLGAEGTVSLLDAASGRVVRNVSIGSSAVLAAIAARVAHAFVIDTPLSGGAATVTMLDTHTGRILHTTVIAHTTGYFDVVAGVDDTNSRVFIVTQAHDLGQCCRATRAALITVLDAHSGQVVGVAHAGRGVTAIGIDARTHRAYIATQDDGLVTILKTT